MFLGKIERADIQGLKPCPFCGGMPNVYYEMKNTGMVDMSTGKHIKRKQYFIQHVNKECMIGGSFEQVGGWNFDSAKEAKEFWNRRAK